MYFKTLALDRVKYVGSCFAYLLPDCVRTIILPGFFFYVQIEERAPTQKTQKALYHRPQTSSTQNPNPKPKIRPKPQTTINEQK